MDRTHKRQRLNLKDGDTVGKYIVIDVIAVRYATRALHALRFSLTAASTTSTSCATRRRTTSTVSRLAACQDFFESATDVQVESTAEKFPILKTELFILLEVFEFEFWRQDSLQIRKKAEAKYFCRVFDKGAEPKYNYMVITLTGPSLKVRDACGATRVACAHRRCVAICPAKSCRSAAASPSPSSACG